MNNLARTALFVLLAALFWPGMAAAHAFRVAFVLPLSGPDAAAGRELHDGFLLATRERDGHPDEESDGHLGGLDVYVLTVDAGRGHAAALAEVKKLIAGGEIAFVVGGPAVASPATKTSAETRWAPDLSHPANRDFVVAFQKNYGYRPTTAAAQGYEAARRLDAAVRAVAGDFSDRAALRAAFAAAEKPVLCGRFVDRNDPTVRRDFYVIEVVKDVDGSYVTKAARTVFPNLETARAGVCPAR